MKITKKINNFIRYILSKSIIKWILIPMVLLLLWICLSLLFSSYRSFTVLQYTHYQDKRNDFFGKKLLKDQELKGEFSAKDNHLGIVSVRFGEIPKVEFEDEDIIVFRIKEKNSKRWLYENQYRSRAFTSNEYFPFGFKEIENSKGKIYEFEIVSKNGNKANSIETKHINPIYLSEYKFSKSEIFGNNSSILKFMSQKVINFITNFDYLLSSSIFFLPFIFYMLLVTLPIKKMINSKGKITGKIKFVIFILTLIFADIIYSELLPVGFTLGLLGLWILAIYLNKFRSNITFSLAFLLIFICVLSIYLNLNISVDKTSAFAYYLLLTGFIQSIGEYKKSKAKVKV